MTRRRTRVHKDIEHADLAGRRARAYVRESAKEQAGADRNGPVTQRASIATYVAKYELLAPDVEYFDAASGKSTKRRPELQRALRDAEAGAYVVLLCYNTSRSFRNPGDADAWKARFRAARVTIVFTDLELISGNRRTRLQEHFLEITDEERVERHGVDVTNGLRQKFAHRRMHNGTPPLGYTRYYGPPGDPQNGLLEPDAHAETVRVIFREYGGGQYSMPVLVRYLNAQRRHDGCCDGDPDCEGTRPYTNRQGKPLTKALIADLLRNRVYLGKIIYHPGTPEEEELDGDHQPLITSDEWDAAVAVRQRNHLALGRRSAIRPYPLTPRAFCHECGASFTGDTQGKYRWRRMRHRVDVDCPNRRSFAAAALEGQLGEIIAHRLTLPAEWERMVARALADESRTVSTEDAFQRARLTRALNNQKKLFGWGDTTESEYHQEVQRIQAELNVLGPTEVAGLPDIRDAAVVLGDLGAWWADPDLSDQTRRDLVEEVFDHISIGDLGIREVWPREPYLPLAEAAEVAANNKTDCWVWSGREDLNLRPLRPERSALPDCATPRREAS